MEKKAEPIRARAHDIRYVALQDRRHEDGQAGKDRNDRHPGRSASVTTRPSTPQLAAEISTPRAAVQPGSGARTTRSTARTYS